MGRFITIIAIVSLFATGGWSNSIADELECARIKERIREIQAKMRSGYTRSQGEKMEAELRKLRVLRSKACR